MSIDFKTLGQGNFRKTGPRSGKFSGPKHSGGGIKTVGADGNMIEVEGGESVGEVNTNAGKQPYIYSQFVKRYGGVSYADEFDKMVNQGAPQQKLDMLAAEQDSKAQRTDGDIKVTPMQRGGFINNNNNMGNKLSSRVMQYDSRTRNRQTPTYQSGGTYDESQTYSGVDGDVGPQVKKQQAAVPESKSPWLSRLISSMLYPVSTAGGWMTSGPKTTIAMNNSGTKDWGVNEWNDYMGPNPLSTEGWEEGGGFQMGGLPSDVTRPGTAQYGNQSMAMQPFQQGGIPPVQQQARQYLQDSGLPQYGHGGIPWYAALGMAGIPFHNQAKEKHATEAKTLEDRFVSLEEGQLENRRGNRNAVTTGGTQGQYGNFSGKQPQYQDGGFPQDWGEYQGQPAAGVMGTPQERTQLKAWMTAGNQNVAGSRSNQQGVIGGALGWLSGSRVDGGPRPTFRQGGLSNRVMQYQGDTGSNIMPLNAEGASQEMPSGSVMGEGNNVNQMMELLKFSGGGGIESLPPEAQQKVRSEFEAMSKAEQQQWMNFMLNGPETDATGEPVFQQQSPTRNDKNEELIQKVMKTMGGPQTGPQGNSSYPLGPNEMQ